MIMLLLVNKHLGGNLRNFFFIILLLVTSFAMSESIDPFWDMFDSRISQADRIKSKIGDCTYTDDTAVRTVVTSDCGDPNTKSICHVVAKCTKSENVQGSCFVRDLCPANPIDCLAKRDIVIIKAGKDAVASPGVVSSSEAKSTK